MATNSPNFLPNTAIDLAGLPEPVAQGIRQLVMVLKEKRIPGPGEQSSEQFITRPNPSPEELDQLLDELSSVSTGKVLPADFSRADIYDEHD